MTAPSPPALRHEALVYSNDDEFLMSLEPFIKEGLAGDEPVVTVTTQANIALLQDRLGSAAKDVEFIDAARWYRHPVQTIASYRDLIGEHLDRGAPRVRVIGEVPFRGDEWDYRDWLCYESVANRAFESARAWIVCPYDARSLPATVVDAAARTHPHVLRRRLRAPSLRYTPPEQFVAQLRRASPATGAVLSYVEVDDLQATRRQLGELAATHGMRGDDAESFVVAVNEVLTNAFLHGSPPVRLRVCREGLRLFCEVSDSGRGFDDVLAGYLPPSWAAPEGGLGLWMARQLCDGVDPVPGSAGMTVRLSKALNGMPEDA